MTFDQLLDDFSILTEWEDRYTYIVEMGKKLPEMSASDLGSENLVRGCTSQVWLTSSKQGDAFHFSVMSDALIVRGLLAILLVMFDGKTSAEIAEVDVEEAFKQLGLQGHLSPNRRNGFAAVAFKMKEIATC